jgi:hypothetical protein
MEWWECALAIFGYLTAVFLIAWVLHSANFSGPYLEARRRVDLDPPPKDLDEGGAGFPRGRVWTDAERHAYHFKERTREARKQRLK